jgi:hypothetical protein
MKHFVLFLFSLFQFLSFAQTSSGIAPTSIPSLAVKSTIINLNPIAGDKFFTIDTKNNSYAYLHSYEDFKKQFRDRNAKGDEKYIQEFIFKTLEDNFSNKDTVNPTSLKDLNTYNRFKEMFEKFNEDN